MFREQVIELLKETGLAKDELERLLEVPPDSKLGDYAFPCFALAKQFRKAPAAIASQLADDISKVISKHKKAVEKVESSGPYVNFFIDKDKLASKVLKEILEDGALYGAGKEKGEKIMVEYPSPNTNKPLHLGHVRNMLLGSSLCNILGFVGYKVIPVNLINDRGIHICKSMLAYKKWGKGKEPDKKSDHFVGDYYVLYSKEAEKNPELEKEAQKMLVKWENNDLETAKLWSVMRKWALKGHEETYKLFDVHHKKSYYESEIYTSGKELVREGLKKGVFQKEDDGAVFVDLEKDGLGKKYLLRADGTTIYITQDIYLAKLKFDDFKMDRSIHVVGNEQAHHFKVLFRILKLLGLPFADKCHHLSYGMIYLPEGRMKSREGTVVDADEIVAELEGVAKKEIAKRHKLGEKELDARAKAIGLGAIKFFFLKYTAEKDFTYNPEESISFEGETGPYVQYAYARISSILRQAKKWKPDSSAKLHFSHEKEYKLASLLSEHPAVVAEAAERYDPSFVARHALLLAQAFSTFYQECPVLKEEKQVMESRLTLIHAVQVVLKSELALLGIDAPEEM